MAVEIGKVGDTLTIDQWIKVRNAVARRLEGGLLPTGASYRYHAEKILKAGYVDLAAVLKSLEPAGDESTD